MCVGGAPVERFACCLFGAPLYWKSCAHLCPMGPCCAITWVAPMIISAHTRDSVIFVHILKLSSAHFMPALKILAKGYIAGTRLL